MASTFLYIIPNLPRIGNLGYDREYTMRWTDVQDIAIALEEQHPDADNINLRFTDLRQWILDLPGFEGAADGCNEKLLEAIQSRWMEERE